MKRVFFVILAVILMGSGIFDTANGEEFFDQRGRYLIIVHDVFYNAALPLAQWKHQKGLEVEIGLISQIGSTQNQIDDFIQNAYETWEVPPEYVLLFGDTEFVPAGSNSPDGDSPYGNVEGDFHEELYIGRFSVDSVAEAELLVSKTLNYERYPYMNDPSWFTRACLICNDFDYSPDEYIADTEYITQLMENAGYDNIHDLRATNGDDAYSVINLVNQGVTFVNYRGQGGGQWASPFNVFGFQTSPGWKLPIVISGTCSTGGISWDVTHGEDWMRARVGGSPAGAVGYFGTSTAANGFITNLRSAVDRGFFDAVFLDGEYELGKVAWQSKEHLIDVYPTEISEYIGWILQGDPSLNIRTETPQEITVSHPDIIPAGSAEFTVNCSLNDEPFVDALVCLYKQDDVYGWAYSDENGDATLQFFDTPIIGQGLVNITVTGKNLMPYENTLQIVAEEAIEGYVTEATTGNPIHARISTPDFPSYTFAEEQEGGFYRLYVPDPGFYEVHANYWGYENFVSEPIEVAELDTIQYNFTMSPLEDAGSIQGTITDNFGEEIGNVKISLSGVAIKPVYSDENGYFSFFPLVPDYDYQVVVEHPSYDSQSKIIRLNSNETKTLDFIMYYIEIFEESNGGFESQAPLSQWQWGIPDASGGPLSTFSGEKCWGTNLSGNYEANSDYSLYSPEYTIGDPQVASLKFYHWCDFHPFYDGGNVQISFDGGDTWELIVPEGGYDHQSVIGLGEPGYTVNRDEWEEAFFDLTDLVSLGDTVQFRFRFASFITSDRGWFIDNLQMSGVAPYSGIYDDGFVDVPLTCQLYSNYPNPFNPATTIQFEIPIASQRAVKLQIYDVSGKLIKTLIDEPLKAGYHSVVWSGKDDAGDDVASGVYFYKLETDSYTKTKSMLLLK